MTGNGEFEFACFIAAWFGGMTAANRALRALFYRPRRPWKVPPGLVCRIVRDAPAHERQLSKPMAGGGR